MKNLLLLALLLIPVFAFCVNAGESENSMNLTVTSSPHINTNLKIDAYTIEPDQKCWIMTYYGDLLIERSPPYESKSSDTPVSLIQFLLTDPDKQITGLNGAMHYNVKLDPMKYVSGETYQVLVECGSLSCAMENFTTTPLRFYESEILGINYMWGIKDNARYMINMFLGLLCIGIIISPFLYLKLRRK
jgi:hypothetical protein